MPSSQTSYRPLRRSRTDRVFAGVCAGFGRFLGIDPVAARVLYVLGVFITGGALILAYFVFWAFMPEEPIA
jgi:phage shock protein C